MARGSRRSFERFHCLTDRAARGDDVRGVRYQIKEMSKSGFHEKGGGRK